MSTTDLAIIALGVNSLASTGALVYVVRRVSPWPKPPAPPAQNQGPGSRKKDAGTGQADDGQAPAANGSEPARSTP
jgi:hypothetical protein